MKRAAPLLLLVTALAAHPQELKQDVLDRLKAATVFITVKMAGGEASGTGFLFLKRGSVGYVMTCEHVVGAAAEVSVVFNSGQTGERSFVGKVIATDPDRDLACVLLKDAKDLPAPLELGQKTAVKETESVYAAGFPFGKMLAAGAKNPEISITKAVVSSIRKDASGRMVAVQMSGDINPGNSGGPLIDARGKVVGVTQSKVRGTGTAFAVPPEEVAGFLKGRVKASHLKEVSATATSARYEVTVELVDPLGTLKSVSFAYCGEDAVPDPKPDATGIWGKIHASMKTVPCKISEDVATATFDLSRAANDPALSRYLFQITYTTGEGKTIWTQPGTLDVKFVAADAPPKPPPPGEKPKPEEPAKEIPVGDQVAIVAKLRLNAVIADLYLAPDGSAYVLDLSDGKIHRVNVEKLEITAQVDVPDNAVAMALTQDGKTLYVGVRDPGRDDIGAGTGAIQVIPTASLKPTSTFSVPVPIFDLDATNNGMIAAVAAGQWDCFALIDASKKSIVGREHMMRGFSHVRVHPDQSRIYSGDTDVGPGDFRCTLLRKEKDPNRGNQELHPTWDSPYHGEHALGGDFALSPDGKYLIGCRGALMRLGKTKDADLRHVVKIDPCLSIAVARGSSTFVTSTADGFLKVYDLNSGELKKSVKLDRICLKMVLDPARQRIYAAAAPVPTEQRFDPWKVRVCDLVTISLSGK